MAEWLRIERLERENERRALENSRRQLMNHHYALARRVRAAPAPRAGVNGPYTAWWQAQLRDTAWALDLAEPSARCALCPNPPLLDFLYLCPVDRGKGEICDHCFTSLYGFSPGYPWPAAS